MNQILHRGANYTLVVSREDGVVRIGNQNLSYWVVQVDPRDLPGYSEQEHNEFVNKAKQIAEQRLRNSK